MAVSSFVIGLIYGRERVWSAAWPPLLYAANYVQILGGDIYNSHTWSLSVEEHFYAIWPWIIGGIALHRLGRRLLKIAFGLILIRLAVGFVDTTWGGVWGSIACAYAFVLGGVLAASLRLDSWQPVRLPRRTPELAVGILVLIGQLSLVFDEWNSTVIIVWVPVVAAGLATLAIARLVADPPGLFAVGWLRYVGRISYGWYLWHAPFMFLVPFNQSLSNRIVVAVVSFGVAALSWHFMEKPILDRRGRPEPLSPTDSTVVHQRPM